MECLVERRHAVVIYPIRLHGRQVNDILLGGNKLRVKYGCAEYGYDVFYKKVVPIEWFPGQLLYAQETFDIEIESNFERRVYHRDHYPNPGWRNWQPAHLMLESESRLKLKVLEVGKEQDTHNTWTWVLTVEKL